MLLIKINIISTLEFFISIFYSIFIYIYINEKKLIKNILSIKNNNK